MKLNYLANIRFPMERANSIQTIETCHALARAGVEVELTVRRSGDKTIGECLEFYGLPEHPNLKLHRAKTPFAGSLLGQLSFAARSLARCRSGRFSAFYTRDLLLADLLLRVQLWHRLPVVYEAHTSAAAFAEEAPRLYSTFPAPTRGKLERLKRRETRVYRRVSRLVTITNALRNFLEERYGPMAPVEVIPDGARVPLEFPPLRDIAAGQGLHVAYIGQLYPWKGVDTVLFAMKDLPEHELVIVGG